MIKRDLMSGSMLATLAAVVFTTGLFAGTAKAQEEGPNTGAISVSISADVYSEYWFRGIFQEDQGFIFQPGVTVSASLVEEENWNFSIYGGNWNSLHGDGDGSSEANRWYESDWFFGGTLGIYDFYVDVSYIFLYGPNAGGIFAEEVDIEVGYDDQALWGEDFPLPGWTGLQPYVLLAIETDGASDAGGATQPNDEGMYLELGIEPGFTLIESETYPVDISVPLVLGIGLDDYYEHPGFPNPASVPAGPGSNEDETFGFFLAGLHASMPLTFVPAEYGSWSIWAGVDVIVLNDDYIEATVSNDYDTVRVVGGGGLAIEY